MINTTSEADKLHPFVKNEWLRMKKTEFFVNMLFVLIGYIGITLWLNAIRANANLWFVWVLIIIQFVLYCLVFSTSYQRFKACGYKRFGIIPFIVFAVLGRVENWELVIIPLLVISMLIISARNKNLLDNEIQ